MLGLVYFLGMRCPGGAGDCGATAARWVRWSRLGLAGIGALAVVYLLYVELFVVDAICLWCTAVHVLTFALFVLTAYREAFHPATIADGRA